MTNMENREHETTDVVADEAAASNVACPVVKKPHKKMIVVGIIATVLVVVGAGFWVWHEQPSFCNAVCHGPMDKYVESYTEGDPGKLVTQHAAAGTSCLSCHEAEITTQVSEAMTWVSDSYPMGEDGLLATGTEFANEEFCARSECHSMADIVANTWGFAENNEKYNPHASHQDGALECSDCHRVHETSTLYCAKCHEMNLPEGWEATNE